MSSPDRTTIHIRISTSLLKRLKIAAVESDRSMNAEVSARLDRSFTDGDGDRAKAAKLLKDALVILDKGGGK